MAPSAPASRLRVVLVFLKRLLRWIGTQELASLIVFGTVVAGAWAFVELADEVVEGETRSLDEAVLLAMRNPDDLADPIGPHWIEELGRDFTALGGVGVLTLISLAVIGFLVLQGKRRAAILVAVAIGGGLLVSQLMKMGFQRPRPDLVPHHSYVMTASFPSGHSMMSAVTYLTLGALVARVQPGRRLKAYILAVAAIFTIGVGVSRVYLGVHWPTDILAGWTAGAAWAGLCWVVARWLQDRGEIEQEPEDEIDPPPHMNDAETSAGGSPR